MTGAAAPRSWAGVLGTLLGGGGLDAEAAEWAMNEIVAGEATPAQIAGFVIALRATGETSEVVGGLSAGMLANAAPVDLDLDCVDIVGTGGDLAHTVNISTMAAIVVAGAGVPVAKHGNRAASSMCGAADLLEELGIVISLDGPAVVRCVREAGIGFFFAPMFHAGMRYAGPARKELGIPTVFNFLGPLSNPARPAAQAVGCADARMAPVMAEVLSRRGTSALVFRGDDGLDELTTSTTSTVWSTTGGVVQRSTLDPRGLGIAMARTADLAGGAAPYNAAVARELLAGKPGPVRDAVLLNAAAALCAFAGLPARADDLPEALATAMTRAAAAVDSGAAAKTLTRWVEVSQA